MTNKKIHSTSKLVLVKCGFCIAIIDGREQHCFSKSILCPIKCLHHFYKYLIVSRMLSKTIILQFLNVKRNGNISKKNFNTDWIYSENDKSKLILFWHSDDFFRKWENPTEISICLVGITFTPVGITVLYDFNYQNKNREEK